MLRISRNQVLQVYRRGIALFYGALLSLDEGGIVWVERTQDGRDTPDINGPVFLTRLKPLQRPMWSMFDGTAYVGDLDPYEANKVWEDNTKLEWEEDGVRTRVYAAVRKSAS